jgi:hypothetical protein
MMWWKMRARRMGESAGEWRGTAFPGLIMLLCLLSLPIFSRAVEADDSWTGQSIMNEVLKRHEMSPYVYEEQTLILEDKAGNRDVSKVRRFSRVEKEGEVKVLLVFDSPTEVRGVALLAMGHQSGRGEWRTYLPAFGKELKFQAGRAGGSRFLGTDFALEDLIPEVVSDFRYVRAADQRIDQAAHFVVEAFPQDDEVARMTGYSQRRHFIRQDSFFIVRTDYYDRRKRFFKRQTFHDLKRVDGDLWRADLMIMENHKEQHKTLIKTNRRVFSSDYAPPEMFTAAWLLENRHIQSSEKTLFRDPSRSLGEIQDQVPDGPQNDRHRGR